MAQRSGILTVRYPDDRQRSEGLSEARKETVEGGKGWNSGSVFWLAD